MNLEEVRAIVGRYTCYPGQWFEVHQDITHNLYYFIIFWKAPSSNPPHSVIKLTREQRITGNLVDEQMIENILGFLTCDLMKHEAQEWFKKDGKRVFDIHGPEYW